MQWAKVTFGGQKASRDCVIEGKSLFNPTRACCRRRRDIMMSAGRKTSFTSGCVWRCSLTTGSIESDRREYVWRHKIGYTDCLYHSCRYAALQIHRPRPPVQHPKGVQHLPRRSCSPSNHRIKHSSRGRLQTSAKRGC